MQKQSGLTAQGWRGGPGRTPHYGPREIRTSQFALALSVWVGSDRRVLVGPWAIERDTVCVRERLSTVMTVYIKVKGAKGRTRAGRGGEGVNKPGAQKYIFADTSHTSSRAHDSRETTVLETLSVCSHPQSGAPLLCTRSRINHPAHRPSTRLFYIPAPRAVGPPPPPALPALSCRRTCSARSSSWSSRRWLRRSSRT